MPGTVVEQLIIQIAGDSKKLKAEYKKVKKENKGLAGSFKALEKVAGKSLIGIGAAAVTLGVIATKAFVKFEKGVTNVAKTTNLAGKDLEDFKNEILDMSEEIPVTTDRLLEIATAAGQLGIKGTRNLTKFTEVIAKLGATTNVEGEEAALAIARILNLTNESIDSVDKLGSALVDLGNNFAASEAEILEVAKDVAKSVVQFDLASDEILGISAAMASLGIAAEAGGTVVGKAFLAIDKAIRSKAGPAFDKLIELTGMTGDQLIETFQDDASKVFQSFIEGLGKAEKKGKDLTEEMGALGLSGIRVNKILPTLATRSDILADAMERAGEASKDASALNIEAAIAFETSAARIDKSQNKINKSLVKIGEDTVKFAIPAIELFADVLADSVEVHEIWVGKGVQGNDKMAKSLQKTIADAKKVVDSWMIKNDEATDSWIKNKDEEEAATKRSEKAIEKIKEDGVKKREKIAKDNKEYEIQKKFDDKMFDQINQMSDDVEFEHKERQKEILATEIEFRKNMHDLTEQQLSEISLAEKRAYNKKIKLLEDGQKAERENVSTLDALYSQYHGKRLQDEGMFGKSMLALKEFQGQAEYGAVRTAADQLSKLINSENNELKTIGKAATIIQIGMSTVESAMKAFNSLAWIPYVGWALGGVAAAAIGAYGLEQTNKVRGMKEGGVVSGVGTGDKVPALLEPGELVVPRDITKDILEKYGARKMQDGGRAVGEKEATSLHQTFADIFEVPDIFQTLIAGDDIDSGPSGFGADSFQGMVPAMMGALRESAYTQQEELLSAGGNIPMGRLLAQAQVLMNKPIDELNDILSDNAVTNWIGENLGSDVAAVLTGGGPLQDAINHELNKVINDIGRHISKIFGFQEGGVPGFVEPGEMRLSKNALSAIANGVNMSKNTSAVASSPSIRKGSTSSGSMPQELRFAVDLYLNQNLAEFVNAEIREGSILGTINPA